MRIALLGAILLVTGCAPLVAPERANCHPVPDSLIVKSDSAATVHIEVCT
jgi:hypothetical protein